MNGVVDILVKNLLHGNEAMLFVRSTVALASFVALRCVAHRTSSVDGSRPTDLSSRFSGRLRQRLATLLDSSSDADMFDDFARDMSQLNLRKVHSWKTSLKNTPLRTSHLRAQSHAQKRED